MSVFVILLTKHKTYQKGLMAVNLTGITDKLAGGAELRAFCSVGGLRVVRIEREGTLLGYGEHPSLEDALSHANEDILAGHREYKEVYGESKPHYLTGSSTPTSLADQWVLSGNKIRCFFDNLAQKFVCEMTDYLGEAIKKGVGGSFDSALEDAQG